MQFNQPIKQKAAKYLFAPDTREAKAWLLEGCASTRNFEDFSHQDAINLVDQLYEAGATAVIVINDLERQPFVTAVTLLIETPVEPRIRARLYQFMGRVAYERGFSPTEDSGNWYEIFVTADISG